MELSTGWRRLLWILLLLGVIARLAFGGIDSLWLDEIYSLRAATGPTVAELWRDVVDSRHPPLYYLALKGTLALLGSQSAFAARLPSALASLGSLAVVAWLARQLMGRDPAPLLAATLLALSPLDLWYAGEARMYAMLTLCGLLLAAGLVAGEKNAAAGFGLVALALGAGLQLSFVMIPLWAGLTALWLVARPRGSRRPASAGAVLGAMTLAWAPFVALRWDQLARLLESPGDVFLYRRLDALLGGDARGALVVMLGLALVAGGVGLSAAWLSRAWRRPNARRWLDRVVMIAFLLATAAFVVPRFYTAKRLLVSVWPFVVLLAVWIVMRLERARPGRALGVMLGVSLLAGLATVLTPRDDWRGVVAYLNASVPAEAQVWIDPRWNLLAYGFYGPTHPARSDRLGETAELAATAATAGEIWLVAERFGSSPPTSMAEAWLDRHWQLIERRTFVRLEVRRYRP